MQAVRRTGGRAAWSVQPHRWNFLQTGCPGQAPGLKTRGRKGKVCDMNDRSEKKKKAREKRKYSRVANLAWAMKNLWRLDRHFVFFIFATVPISVLTPLVKSLFSRELIDTIGAGRAFEELALVALGFCTGILALNLLDEAVYSRCNARQYYPSGVYQTKIGKAVNFDTDYENTDRQDYQEIAGYAYPILRPCGPFGGGCYQREREP